MNGGGGTGRIAYRISTSFWTCEDVHKCMITFPVKSQKHWRTWIIKEGRKLKYGPNVVSSLKDFWLEKQSSQLRGCWLHGQHHDELLARSNVFLFHKYLYLYNSPTMDTTQQTIKLPLKKNKESSYSLLLKINPLIIGSLLQLIFRIQ